MTMLHHSPADGFHIAPSIETIPRTFRTFVTGPQNALAYNAALTVARTPGTMYSPLYLSGPSGLGKTHLLHAIAAYLRVCEKSWERGRLARPRCPPG